MFSDICDTYCRYDINLSDGNTPVVLLLAFEVVQPDKVVLRAEKFVQPTQILITKES